VHDLTFVGVLVAVHGDAAAAFAERDHDAHPDAGVHARAGGTVDVAPAGRGVGPPAGHRGGGAHRRGGGGSGAAGRGRAARGDAGGGPARTGNRVATPRAGAARDVVVAAAALV